MNVRHAAGTSAKYLEKPAREKKYEIFAEIARVALN